MTRLALLLLAVTLETADSPPRAEPFRVSCGDHYCTLRNETAEFRATERGLGLERIAGFDEGASVALRLETGDGASRIFTVTMGEDSAVEHSPREPARQLGRRSLTSLIDQLSQAVRISIGDCRTPATGGSSGSDPCVVTLSGLDNAVIEARTRLRMARRSY